MANVLPTRLVPTKRVNPLFEWLKLAARPAIVKRAIRTAALVGLVLSAINHGSEMLAGKVTGSSVLQMCLTITVPYIVSTTSSVATLKGMRDNCSDVSTPD